MPHTPTTEPAEGTHYRLVRTLDTVAGAQRLLARCEPAAGPGPLVVIKRLPARARWAQRRRLAHEAWVARRLEHPGLTRVLHAETNVRHPLIIMEHLEGVRLERVLTWAAGRAEHQSPGARPMSPPRWPTRSPTLTASPMRPAARCAWCTGTRVHPAESRRAQRIARRQEAQAWLKIMPGEWD